LERLGWKVINVRYGEWISAKTKAEKRVLMAQKLRAIGVRLSVDEEGSVCDTAHNENRIIAEILL
jgi:hypothetical protein